MGTTKIIIIITIKEEEKPAALKLKGTSIYQHMESRALHRLLNSNPTIQSFLTQPYPSDMGQPKLLWGPSKERD